MKRARREAEGVLLRGEHLAAMRRHARAAYPHECCGVLLGTGGEQVRVEAVHPAINLRADRARDRYEIHPRDILQLERAAPDGQQVIGFYHSHPDHPLTPSPTDAAQAWPGYVYVIVGAQGRARADADIKSAPPGGEARAWAYDEERGCFHEVEVVRAA